MHVAGHRTDRSARHTMSRLRIVRLTFGLVSLASAVALIFRAYVLRPTDGDIAFTNVKYLTAPQKCKHSTKLLVCVFSRPINVEHRLAIRETWGKSFRQNGAEVFFFLGYSKGAILNEEIRVYGDIVQEPFKDSYYNLTLKSLAMVRFAAVFCPFVRHVLKVDDDVLINTKKFLEDISVLRMTRTIWGNLAQGWTPIREPGSKWYVPSYIYNETTFPDFVTGVSYLMSGDCPALLYKGSSGTRYFYLEDVFWTGIIADKMEIIRFHHEGFANSRVFLRACDHTTGPFFMSHGYTPEYLRISWKSLQRRIALCDKVTKSTTAVQLRS